MFCFIKPYFISHPIVLPIGDISLTVKGYQATQGVLSILAAAFIAGLIPAWRAAKENILEAIWGV
jgi:putative ABC transport system permease protein